MLQTFLSQLFEWIARIFAPAKRTSAPPIAPVADPDDPNVPPLTTILKTLIIAYDPVADSNSGKKLSEVMHWNRIDELAKGYISDILLASAGLVRHQIVDHFEVDAFPPKVDDHVYEAQEYLNVVRGVSRPYMPQEVDYHAIFKKFNILQRVANNEIDEVWVFNFPHAGFYESVMAGPGAFWCNAPPLLNTETAKRRFVVMGFSYERGVGEMLENLGHRAESIMEKVFQNIPEEDNLWKRFTRYDKTHPGQSALGNVHYAPNSDHDYDWNNSSYVLSECDDWLYNFPNFKGVTRKVTASEWGNGDIRKHHIWWMGHFPKTKGRSQGVHHNWWQYIANPNNVKI